MKKAWLNRKYITKLACGWTTCSFSLLGFIGTFASLGEILPSNWRVEYKILWSIGILLFVFVFFWCACAILFERKKG